MWEQVKDKIVVILPSLNPDEKLMQVVHGVIEAGFSDLVIVNDGSDEAHLAPFEEAKALPQCTVLTHEVNKGKGRGLKTAFSWVLENRKDCLGVVTVDGDNQHRPQDIKNCALVMSETGEVVLGCRDFSQEDVPPRSRFGNRMTSFVFRFACGMKISDTQTGLRAIPYSFLAQMCQVEGERFEYETNMLLSFKRYDIPYREVSIETVYIEDNQTSHFHPIRDSLKIYGIIFKYLFGAISSCLIDIVLFAIINALTGGLGEKARIFVSTVGARVCSSFYNYNFNRKAVFDSKESMKKTMIRYYILCVVQMLTSYGFVYLIEHALAWGNLGTVLIKIVVDTVLFLISFQIQRAWVFKK